MTSTPTKPTPRYVPPKRKVYKPGLGLRIAQAKARAVQPPIPSISSKKPKKD